MERLQEVLDHPPLALKANLIEDQKMIQRKNKYENISSVLQGPVLSSHFVLGLNRASPGNELTIVVTFPVCCVTTKLVIRPTSVVCIVPD